MTFPERVYTQDEVTKARELIQKGYKHALKIEGDQQFKNKMDQVLDLVKTADYYDFLRTYIRQIVEMEGFSQLHQTWRLNRSQTYAPAAKSMGYAGARK